MLIFGKLVLRKHFPKSVLTKSIRDDSARRVVNMINEGENGIWKIFVEERSSQNGGKLFEKFYLAKKVVNCGGNYSDELDKLVPRNSQMPPPFVIQPGMLWVFVYI